MAPGHDENKRRARLERQLLTTAVNNFNTASLRITHHQHPPQPQQPSLITDMSSSRGDKGVISCDDSHISHYHHPHHHHPRRRHPQKKHFSNLRWMASPLLTSFLFHTPSTFSSSSSSRCKKSTFASLSLLLTLTLTVLIFGTSLAAAAGSFDDFLSDPGDVLKNMVRTFGRELSSAATEQTCLGRIEENFQAYSGEVSYFDGNKMMDDMRQDVINMLNWKRHAVDRIANESERISSNHTFDKNLDNFPFLNVNQPPIDSEDDGGGGGGGGGDGDDKKDEPIGIKPEGLRPSTAAANFDGYEVDLESSAVHIPVNVFHKAVEVINDIKWSDALTPFFKNNLAFDPSLSWQFFGSAKGFLRLYPAFQWREPPNLKVGAEAVGEDGSLQPPPSVDFYDCRMRSWYIQGAASPKDIVLLLDTSGSMLGRRRILASDVVSKILDTLTEDDYVAAYQFNKNVTPICGCLDRLVRATKRNVLTIKGALPGLKSENPVNFTGALLEAFSTLQAVNKSGRGSQCNQAIMIVTDGAPSTYEEIFRQFNYPNIPVRVFTYQVGKDVTMNGEMYWMACENRGYFTHVANRAEVHEQVQKYIPVLSRPVVLSGQRIFSWTPVYAPNSKMELTDWNWDNKQKSEFVANLRANGALGLVSGDQSSVSLAEETAPESSATAESSDLLESRHSTQKHVHDRRQTIAWAHGTAGNIDDPVDDQLKAAAAAETSASAKTSDKSASASEHSSSSSVHSEPYISPRAANYLSPTSKRHKRKSSKCDVTLYTTLSTSVFDTRNYTNITRRVLIKNVYQDKDPEQIHIANLLGVAGIDVPIKEIIKLTPPFKLGVNGYVFIISNNGYILYHPDLRPCFEDFLKPFYASVDLGEVELANNTNGPRDWSGSEIEVIRNNMIERTHGWKKVAVKMHIDEMRRVVTRVNHYTHGWISNTPFSLAIALPEPYGSYRLTSAVDLKMKFRSENFTAYFRGDQWRVHPDWPYCTSPQRPFHAEDHQGGGGGGNGAQRGRGGGQQHPKSMTPEQVITNFLSVELESNNFRWRTSSIRPQVYDTISCDKDLVQKLVLDAKLTDIPSTKCNTSPNLRDDQRIKTFGIATTFVATRSGLTRFTDYRSAEEIARAREGDNGGDGGGEAPFYEEHTRAIEETYYQRAVDFYATHNRDAFVYSVDFDVGAAYAGRVPRAANFLVTATHALFIGNGKQSTPVAVVGIQFRYGVLHEFFLNTTNKFNVPCTHMDMDCYLLDNNGFVLLSGHKVEDVGRFFGEIDGDILTDLVEGGVLRKVHMYDYQAICVKRAGEAAYGPSARPFAFSLAHFLLGLLSNLFNTLAALYVDLTYLGPWRVLASLFECKDPDSKDAEGGSGGGGGGGGGSGPPPYVGGVLGDFIDRNMTTAQPCDKEFDLFEMMDFSNVTRVREVGCGQSPGCGRKYLAQYVPHTNLLMVMVDNHPGCNCIKSIVDIEPKEIVYSRAEMCSQLREEKSRKRPQSCHSYHAQEKDIRQCGAASSLRVNALAVSLLLILTTTLFRWLSWW